MTISPGWPPKPNVKKSSRFPSRSEEQEANFQRLLEISAPLKEAIPKSMWPMLEHFCSVAAERMTFRKAVARGTRV